MLTTDVEDWEEFRSVLTGIRTIRSANRTKHSYVSSLLFRGHADANWKLETTFERTKATKVQLVDYYRTLMRIRPEVETFTGSSWPDLMRLEEYVNWVASTEMIPGDFPAYEYMLWLRHHGFPSPLLDWSRSPYIAAYFAFANPEVKADRVAIFAYLEYARGAKGHSKAEPHIIGLGPYAKGHKRHFLQQCEYTICIRSDTNKGWEYASHESVFARDEEGQDLLWKITLPSSERPAVLRELETYNISGHSLFGSNESLLHTMALREYVTRGE